MRLRLAFTQQWKILFIDLTAVVGVGRFEANFGGISWRSRDELSYAGEGGGRGSSLVSGGGVEGEFFVPDSDSKAASPSKGTKRKKDLHFCVTAGH